MAGLKLPYLTHEKSTSGFGGTGDVQLDGVPTSPAWAQSFENGVGHGNTCEYAILSGDGNWEITRGAVDTSGSPHTLTRLATPIASTAGGAKVDFAAGVKDIVAFMPWGFAPMVSVSLGSAQSVSNDTATKVQLDTVDFDTFGYFDTSTNFRFTPLTAGVWCFNCGASLANLGDTKYAAVHLYKNGSKLRTGVQVSNGATQTWGGQVSTLAAANGTTDYFELYVHHIHGSSLGLLTTAAETFFQAHWVGR